ncbi:MAG: alpha/beta fold hydrolase [Leptolyngbyaceae cyanobacterium]
MTRPIRNGRIRMTQGTVFWREVGYGPTLLFLHGSWQDSSQWPVLMAQLGHKFHCLAPDLLGFGESSHLSPKNYSVDLETDCLAEYVASLRVQPHVIVADSLGAWVAVRYGLRHLETLQGLVLMAPEGLSHPVLDQRWRTVRWLASPWSMRGRGLQLIAPIRRLLRRDHWLQRSYQRQQKFHRYQATCRLLFQRRQTALKAERLNELLPQLNIPVLLLHPEQASSETQLANTLFHDLAPHAQLLTVAGNESTAWQIATEKISAFVETDAIASP